MEALVVQITVSVCVRCVMGQEGLSRLRRGANKLLATYANELASVLKDNKMTEKQRYVFQFGIIIMCDVCAVQNLKIEIFREGYLSCLLSCLLYQETAGFCHGNKEKKKKMDAWPKEWRKHTSVQIKHLVEMPSNISSIALNNRA